MSRPYFCLIYNVSELADLSLVELVDVGLICWLRNGRGGFFAETAEALAAAPLAARHPALHVAIQVFEYRARISHILR
jgi:hypothetical protein